MGRPKIGEPVLVRLPDDLKARAELKSSLAGISLAELIRRALDAYLREE